MLFRDTLMAAAGGTAGGVDPDAAAYFAAMTVQPDATRKGLLTALIVGLKDDGVWASLDWLSVVAAHDAQAARVNAKNPAQVASVVNTPTFLADRGYTGNFASASYIDTGLLDSAGGNNTQNSSTIFAWVNVVAGAVGAVIGIATGNVSRITLSAGVNRVYRLHSTTAISTATPPTTGLYSISRTGANDIAAYLNGAADGTSGASASTAPVASPYCFPYAAGAAGEHRIAAAGVGGALDATKQAALYSRLNTYLTAVGGA